MVFYFSILSRPMVDAGNYALYVSSENILITFTAPEPSSYDKLFVIRSIQAFNFISKGLAQHREGDDKSNI